MQLDVQRTAYKNLLENTSLVSPINGPGATALETGNFGQIEVLGYEGGELDIRTGGNHESGIIAILSFQGNAVG